ncbi:hypothetical protein EYD45_05865 [Hyunsoonleella flava]|uniref:Sensor of ECF-type sigma factor n=1 Tax=Hyunsoonleella flava TaxID=2527939 RepID=A0A4Q9FK30_9FLAO|nr:hypothetical protein [Hyunsoonleella flava]TBN04785.1 hypothetical protein EYD45_05865 [Hyunsoonleella flava]
MKKTLIIIVLLISFGVNAQKGKRHERIKALKVSFLTERLSLTEKEAQKFWPIYNGFEEKMNEIRFNEMRNIRSEIRENIDTMSDDEALVLIERFKKAEEQMHTVKTEFFDKISKVISPKKMILLRIAEDDFKKKMLEEFKKRRMERG